MLGTENHSRNHRPHSCNSFVTVTADSPAGLEKSERTCDLQNKVIEDYRQLAPGNTWVNFCWVCAAGLSETLLYHSLICGQL